MLSSEAALCTNPYGGIFREEIAQQLLERCVQLVRFCFYGLHERCTQLEDAASLFARCVETVRTAWSESDFQQETQRLGPDFEACVRGSFIAYARMMHMDPSGQATVQIRLTVPPPISFVREFLRDLAQDDTFRTGSYFGMGRLEQKDVVMKCIRVAFSELGHEYIYVGDNALPADAAEDGDDVAAEDSVSACGDDARTPGPAAAVENGAVAADASEKVKPPPTEAPSGITFNIADPAAAAPQSAGADAASVASASSAKGSATSKRSTSKGSTASATSRAASKS